MTDNMTRKQVLSTMEAAQGRTFLHYGQEEAAHLSDAIAAVSAMYAEVEAYRAVLREFQDGRRISNPHTRQVARDIEQQAIDRSSGSS